MSVMPICTVERNLSGFPERSRAFCAALLPFLASVDKRDLRAEIIATSDMENIPFNNIKPIMIRISFIFFSFYILLTKSAYTTNAMT